MRTHLNFKQVSIKGGVRILPNCDQSRLLQKLMGKNGRGRWKTFKPSDLKILEDMGFKISHKLEEAGILDYE